MTKNKAIQFVGTESVNPIINTLLMNLDQNTAFQLMLVQYSGYKARIKVVHIY